MCVCICTCVGGFKKVFFKLFTIFKFDHETSTAGTITHFYSFFLEIRKEILLNLGNLGKDIGFLAATCPHKDRNVFTKRMTATIGWLCERVAGLRSILDSSMTAARCAWIFFGGFLAEAATTEAGIECPGLKQETGGGLPQ